MDLTKWTKMQLLEKCKEHGITNCSSKNKNDLIDLLEKHIATKSETNVSHTTKHTFIEVCAGGGGLSAGLIKSGFIPLLLNDNNRDCCKTLKQNHPEANVVLGSMDSIDYSKYIGCVDLLTGGVPCQSFSQAGLRKGLDDPRGDLMMKFIDILNVVKPKIFMIENVKGLLSHEGGNTIQRIIDTMNDSNLYNIQYKCLDASKYNVPQYMKYISIFSTVYIFQLYVFMIRI